MAIPNEILINSVFTKMVQYKPILQNMIISDEENPDILDPRILGDVVIRNFPWPIGVELRRLFSAPARQLDRMRLDQLFKTIERSLQFLSFIMISQLWIEIKVKKLELPENIKKEFISRIMVLSLGNYTWLIRTTTNFFKEMNIKPFLTEMSENINQTFLSAIDFWVPERNEIGHYQINLTNEEIEKRCVEYEEKLSFILATIAFLCRYKLVSIRDIKVIHPRNKMPRFNHLMNILNSSDSGFKPQEIEETKFCESNSVLLLKSVKSIDEYLNLSPLVIDTNSEIIDDKKKFEIKKDIFLYTKFRNNHLMYAGTEVTERCDLRNLHNYSNLLEQFNDMLLTISPESVDLIKLD